MQLGRYLEGQLIREGVSPSESFWRNHSYVGFPGLLCTKNKTLVWCLWCCCYTHRLHFKKFFGHPVAYGAPRPGIRSEPQSGTKLWLQQCQILNPLSQARDWTHIPMLPRHCQAHCAMAGAPRLNCYTLKPWSLIFFFFSFYGCTCGMWKFLD